MERERPTVRLTFRKARELVRTEIGSSNRLKRHPTEPGAFRMQLGRLVVTVRWNGEAIELKVDGIGQGHCVGLYDIDTLQSREQTQGLSRDGKETVGEVQT